MKKLTKMYLLLAAMMTIALAFALLSGSMAPAEMYPTSFTAPSTWGAHMQSHFDYTVQEDDSALLLHYSGPAGNIVIPNELDGHPIMAVRGNPFADCRDEYTLSVSRSHPYLATINGVLFGKSDRKLICYPVSGTAPSYAIPDGIEIIGDEAFYGCEQLVAVTIPESVTRIGNQAFSDCENLVSITIPEGVTDIGNGAFDRCGRLTNVAIPGSVTGIGDRAFADCDQLVSVTIPEGVTGIGSEAFYGCNAL